MIIIKIRFSVPATQMALNAYCPIVLTLEMHSVLFVSYSLFFLLGSQSVGLILGKNEFHKNFKVEITGVILHPFLL